MAKKKVRQYQHASRGWLASKGDLRYSVEAYASHGLADACLSIGRDRSSLEIWVNRDADLKTLDKLAEAIDKTRTQYQRAKAFAAQKGAK